ncbi:MAG: hypothetical protein ACYS1C_10890 [Planctomycetota bacterium]|jgi:hypothetical protein
MERPTSVTVFGVLNIVFAVLGLIGVLIAAVSIAAVRAMGGMEDPLIQAIWESPVARAWNLAALPLGLAATIALFAAGVGLLLLKPWARILSLIWGIYDIVMEVGGLVIHFAFIRPALAQVAGGPDAMRATFATVGAVVGGCLGVIYPILLLIFMTRPRVVDAFEPEGAPPAA